MQMQAIITHLLKIKINGMNLMMNILNRLIILKFKNKVLEVMIRIQMI